MLIRKTLLEKEFGFYNSIIQNIDLSFPWKIPEEYIDDVVKNPNGWKMEQRWRFGTISRLLRIFYWVFILLYVVVLIGVLIVICGGYFAG